MLGQIGKRRRSNQTQSLELPHIGKRWWTLVCNARGSRGLDVDRCEKLEACHQL
jgi:hypothetical protein